MSSGLKDLKIALNLAHMMKKLCKVIPSYAKKGVQTHYHRITTNLWKVAKTQ